MREEEEKKKKGEEISNLLFSKFKIKVLKNHL